jgi:hypothetical protein
VFIHVIVFEQALWRINGLTIPGELHCQPPDFMYVALDDMYVQPTNQAKRTFEIKRLLKTIAKAHDGWADVSNLESIILWFGNRVPAWVVCCRLIEPGAMLAEVQKYTRTGPDQFQVSMEPSGNWRFRLISERLVVHSQGAAAKPSPRPKPKPPPLPEIRRPSERRPSEQHDALQRPTPRPKPKPPPPMLQTFGDRLAELTAYAHSHPPQSLFDRPPPLRIDRPPDSLPDRLFGRARLDRFTDKNYNI